MTVATNGDAGSGEPDPVRAGIAHVRRAEAQAVITSTENMLAARESRTAWLQQTYGMNVANDLLVQARFGGAQAGPKNAEDFRLLHHWPHTGDWSILP